MPIRFRCRYCNQLMGISRRKAGTTVQCPTCHGQVVVPHSDAEEQPPAAAAPQPAAEAPAPLFERSDFEAFLESPAQEPAPAPAPFPTVPQPAPRSPSAYEGERLQSPSLALGPGALAQPPVGLVLSPLQATWLTVVAILLLALAFGAGLLIGHYWIG